MKKQESLENEEIDNTIVKKRIIEIASTKKKIINATSKKLKEEVKQQQILDGEIQKKKEEQIVVSIENNNIINDVQEILKKFNPPKCSNCENGTADRVCINKTCRNNFMQLICSKCHFKEHQVSIVKPEIDLKEFFIKLATFFNEQKDKENISNKIFNSYPEGLSKSLNDINRLRQKLNELKEQLKIEVEEYKKPTEMQFNLSNLITKALSLCEYDNVQEQLNLIKKIIFFNGKQFGWNDCHEKYKNINLIFQKLENNANDISKSINKSLFNPGMSIDLTDIDVIRSCTTNFTNCEVFQIKLIDNELYFINNQDYNQMFLNYKLEYDCKYKIRFRFESEPSDFIVVGVLPFSQASYSWVPEFESHFCKIFYKDCPWEDCSRVLKGQDNRHMFKKGDQCEMRIDFKNYYMDVYDYPEMKNINANQLDNKVLPNESFVFAVQLTNSQCIVLESIQEINEIIPFQ